MTDLRMPRPDICGLDTETHLIAADAIVPRLVCATFDVAPWDSIGEGEAWCIPNADPSLVGQLVGMFDRVLDRTLRLPIQNAAFDVTVLLRYAWDVMHGDQVGNKDDAEKLYGMIWDALDQGMQDELAGGGPTIHCTLIREKLFNLSTTGMIDQHGGRDLSYSLASFVKTYFGEDIFDAKVTTGLNGTILDSNGNDITGTPKAAAAWRLRYKELDGMPLSRWPTEAERYAISDATWARKVFVMQERSRRPQFQGSMNSESLQVYADTALRMYSTAGFPVDQEQVHKVAGRIDAVVNRVELSLQLNGIVRLNHTVCSAVLQDRVVAAWATKGRHPVMTSGGTTGTPQVSSAAEVLDALAGVDPILDQYAERQSLIKIKTAFLPNLAGGRVWSNYDVLKETGRVSSYGDSGKGKRTPLYPAVNIQQIPRSDGVRECFLPPEAAPSVLIPTSVPQRSVMVSVDYNALELCSVAQVTYSLLGYSTHRDMINRGYDLHSYLGASMARALAPHVVDGHTSLDEAYKALVTKRKLKIKKGDESPEALANAAAKKEAGTWRNFAKPVGLGYPGGLGPATLVDFAKATYGISIDEDQAKAFRELWHATYPEMQDYFRWVNQQEDRSSGNYSYETQGFRRFRAGATYCATANGKAMQSLSADGAKRSVCWLARTCFGGVPKSSPFMLLAGCTPGAFIHDENLISLPDDELLTERSLLIGELMVRSMKVSMPDVVIGAEPALMRRWTKAAEPEWVDDPGRERRVEDAICKVYGGVPPSAWVDEFFAALGPKYNPNRRLVPWDDVNKVAA
jgi:hypothetical protein